MKNKVLTIILLFCASILFAQTIAPKKCNTCGKPLVQCQYKGKHPSTTKEKDQSTTSGVSAPTGTHNGYGWVDLGLPSGTKWATMNVGASSPSDYGSYFAWSETSTKGSFTWENLRYHFSGDDSYTVQFSKYVFKQREFNFNFDDKKELDLCDDVAYENWGAGWRMPSKTQQDELWERCKWIWASIGGHNGYKVVGPNGNSLFLPAAGYLDNDRHRYVGTDGEYWSRELQSNTNAYGLAFYKGHIYDFSFFRYYGKSVRAVLSLE